jgi:hypothetical protein
VPPWVLDALGFDHLGLDALCTIEAIGYKLVAA